MYRLFDEYAHRYDWHTPPRHYQHDHAFVLELARNSGTSPRLLDLGCGTGVLLQAVRAAGGQPHGIDSAAGMVRVATERLGAGIVRQGRMQDLDLADCYDVVVSLSWGINYCADFAELHDVLARVHRALTPGGLLVLQVAHAAHATGELFEDREPGPEGQADDVSFFYRFSPAGPSSLKAEYVYVCRSAQEMVCETHQLECADVHALGEAAARVGFARIEKLDSFRRDPVERSVSPWLLAQRRV